MHIIHKIHQVTILINRTSLPPLAALVAFEASARLGSFTKAAQELSLTQSAVSRQVFFLEERAGAMLFERFKQRVRLTPAGQRYSAQVYKILSDLSAATNELRATGRGGTLRLGVPPTFGTNWLVPRMESFFAANPDLEVIFLEWVRPFAFSLEGVDAAIHLGDETWADVASFKLMPERVVPVASPGLLKKLKLKNEKDILSARLLVQDTRPQLWTDWFASRQIHFNEQRSMITFSHFAMVIKAAVAGIGIAVAPLLVMEKEIESGQLIPLFGPPLSNASFYRLLYPNSKADYLPLKAFRNWLLDQIAKENLPE